MGHFRHHMRKGRAALHERMSVPAFAFYSPPIILDEVGFEAHCVFPHMGAEIEPGEDERSPFFGRFTVRVHEKWGLLGDLKGTNFHYAETEVVNPRLILWRHEWSEFIAMGYPFRRLILSIDEGVAYEIDTAKPHDDQTISVEAVRLEPKKTEGFPFPEVL